eukprot:Skav204046  [mRNA]  locus=scaffold3:185477:192402:- [translate_table: standard]
MKTSTAQNASTSIVHSKSPPRISFEKGILQGSIELQLLGLQETERCVLDTRGLDIRSVTADGAAADYEVGTKGRKSEALGEALEVKLPKKLVAGAKAVVRIDYATAPDAVAIQMLSPDPWAARCVEVPTGVKSKYTAKITAPTPLTVLMSAVPDGEPKEGEGGKRCFSFTQLLGNGNREVLPEVQTKGEKVPIPSYLLALACGHLASRRVGPRSHVWSEPEAVEACAFAAWRKITIPALKHQFAIQDLSKDYEQLLLRNDCIDLAKAVELFGHNHEFTKLCPKLRGIDPDDAFSTVPYVPPGLKEHRQPGFQLRCPWVAHGLCQMCLLRKGQLLLIYLEKLVGQERFEAYLRAHVKRFAGGFLTEVDFKNFFLEHFSSELLLDWLVEYAREQAAAGKEDEDATSNAEIRFRWLILALVCHDPSRVDAAITMALEACWPQPHPLAAAGAALPAGPPAPAVLPGVLGPAAAPVAAPVVAAVAHAAGAPAVAAGVYCWVAIESSGGRGRGDVVAADPNPLPVGSMIMGDKALVPASAPGGGSTFVVPQFHQGDDLPRCETGFIK